MPDEIINNPTPAELSRLIAGAKVLNTFAGVARALGLKSEILDGLQSIVDQSDLLGLPDRFNKAFVERGWVACESMSTDAMRAALALHAEGRLDAADEVVTNTFDRDALDRLVLRSHRFHKSKARSDQLAEAIALFEEGRYLAALPLVLIASDGLSYDVAGFGVFTDAADLSAFDSIVGHSSSLPALLANVRASRPRTNVDPLPFPYRNGILHGRDLGYGDRVTCAKGWMIYQALVDWAGAKSGEDERKAQDEARKNTNLKDTLAGYAATKETSRQLAEWQPRYLDGAMEPPFEVGSPEEALFDYLAGWRDGNFMKMGSRSINFVGKTPGKLAHQAREDASPVPLLAFSVLVFEDVSAGHSRAKVELIIKTDDGSRVFDEEISVQLDPGKGSFSLRGPDAVWMVQGHALWRVRQDQANTENS
jgi:hypothetical protein